MKFAVGEKYEINRVVRALDQSGAGKGDLLKVKATTPLTRSPARFRIRTNNRRFVTSGTTRTRQRARR